jgi:hypothetical protein
VWVAANLVLVAAHRSLGAASKALLERRVDPRGLRIVKGGTKRKWKPNSCLCSDI